MKTFKTSCAQGDVMFIKRDALPPAKRLKEVKPERKNELVITHSETGHDHVMVLDEPKGKKVEPAVQFYADDSNPMMSWLKVNRPTVLEHRRKHDTHEGIMFPKGVYEVRRQREFDPSKRVERRVED